MDAYPQIRLTRALRFFLPLDLPAGESRPVLNSWSGWPQGIALAPFLELQCTLAGPIDPSTDYVCNVKQVDAILRQHAIGAVWSDVVRDRTYPEPPRLLTNLWRSVANHVPGETNLDTLRLCVSPYLSFSLHRASLPMITACQQFEFSASHRLHHQALSDDENRRLYGKCNNPHGHGHNYVLETAIELSPESATGYSTETIERIVKEKIIDRLDHRHLNLEVEPFDRLNPTVENIAVTIWGWLVAAFPPGCRLARVRVFETPKTWADYCG